MSEFEKQTSARTSDGRSVDPRSGSVVGRRRTKLHGGERVCAPETRAWWKMLHNTARAQLAPAGARRGIQTRPQDPGKEIHTTTIRTRGEVHSDPGGCAVRPATTQSLSSFRNDLSGLGLGMHCKPKLSSLFCKRFRPTVNSSKRVFALINNSIKTWELNTDKHEQRLLMVELITRNL